MKPQLNFCKQYSQITFESKTIMCVNTSIIYKVGANLKEYLMILYNLVL